MPSADTDLIELVNALGALSDIEIRDRQSTSKRWVVDCLMDVSAAGEQSLSIIAFTVHRHVDDASLDIGGQHDDHPGRACFSLSGPTPETARAVAYWINFGREILRQRESRN
jgi:hypothetical protein